MRVGYLRVSTPDQCLDRQIDGLKGHCDDLHVEMLSAASTNRPVYEAVVSDLQAGDTLVVWNLDRAFRSTVDAILEVEKLHEQGIRLQIVTLNLDTATPEGMFVYTIIAAFAELERRVISKRTKEGLAAARRRGKRLGRPPKLTDAQLLAAADMLREGLATIDQMAEKFDVAPWTLTRSLRRLGASENRSAP